MILHLKALAFTLLCSVTAGMPLEVKIRRNQSYCIIETLEVDEDVTFSVNVIRGKQLRCEVKAEGPIAAADVDTLELKRILDEKRSHRYEFQHGDKVDFAEPSPFRADGEPLLFTRQAKSAGIYKLCVENTSNGEITAMMDIRKSSELGKVDTISGHVPTYETLMILQSLSFDENDSAIKYDVVKEEAMMQAKNKLKQLRKSLDFARKNQGDYMIRLELHKVINEATQSRMVLRSLLETLVFVAATGYQLYLIRKWFSNSGPMGMLGSPQQRKTFY